MIKKTTLKDVASACGVSTTLVSFVLNDRGKAYRVSEEMIKLIRQKAKELNYQPNNAARSLRSGKTNTIGVVLSDISNRFFADIARCIEDCASRNGYTVLYGSTDESHEKFSELIKVFTNKGVDGIIAVPCMGAKDDIRGLLEGNIPVVLIDRTLDDLKVSSVTLDNEKAVVMSVNELLSQGYKSIGFVTFDTDFSNIREREAGYVRAMEKAGLADSVCIRKATANKDILNEMQDLISGIISDGVEAVVFATNRLAIDGLRALMKMGKRVPEDLALIAFDGSETFAFELYPTSISYVKQPMESFGKEAFSILKKQMDEEVASSDAPVEVILEPELVVRSSSSKRE